MTHLFRGGWLLAAALVAFLIFRAAPETLSFGLLETSRGDNAAEWMAWPSRLVAPTRCTECHGNIGAQWTVGRHRTVHCEDCHGSAAAHVENQSPLTLPEGTAALCGACHGRLLSRPGAFPQIDLASHGEGEACVSCHNPHSPGTMGPHQPPGSWQEMAQCLTCHDTSTCSLCHSVLFFEPGGPGAPGVGEQGGPPAIPHDLAGREDCLSCHAPNGQVPVPADHAGRENDMCPVCHKPG